MLIVVEVTKLIIYKRVKQEEKEIEFRYISLNNNTQESGGGGGGGGGRGGRIRTRRRRRGRGAQGSDAPPKKAKTPKVKEKVNRRPFAGHGNNNTKDSVRIT